MTRRWGIWIALAGTLFACWWVEQAEPPAPVVVAKGEPRIQRRIPLAQALPDVVVSRQDVITTGSTASVDDADAVNLFAAMSTPESDAMEVESQMPEPVNPYTYAGRLREGDRWVIFLTDGQQQYVLHEGEYFAGDWQVALLDQQKVVLQHAAERFEIRLDNGVVF
jgi:hypothetical protein